METKEQKVSLFDIETGLLETASALQEVEEGLTVLAERKESGQSVDEYTKQDRSELEQRRADLMAVLETYLTEAPAKRDRVAGFVKLCEAQIEHCKAEKNRINARQKGIENMLERVKGHFVHVMHALKTRKLEGNTSVISLRKRPDKLEIGDTDHIPARFLVIAPPPPVTVDTGALLAWAKAEREKAVGCEVDWFEPLPGVRVIPGGDSLQVR